MNSEPTIRRLLYTHNHLLGAARGFSKQANEEDSFNSAMAAAMFCALALEAALNYIGSAVEATWDAHLQRKLSPEGKLAFLASRFAYEIDFGQRPFQGFRALFELRNQLAHGTTQDLSYETAKHWLIYGDRKWPAAQWETLCTGEQAERLVEDTERMITILHSTAGVEAIPAFMLSEHV